MGRKFFRFCWGLALLPFALSTLCHLPLAFFRFHAPLEPLALLFFGILIYVLFESLFRRPLRTYVFGHELTHALACLALGGKVHSFRASEKGGSVTLSRTNFFIALAPYCIPIYTLFVLILYALAQLWVSGPASRTIFVLLLGFTLAFHCSLTIFAMRREQPDIRGTGVFFSLVFILLANGWVFALVAKLLFWKDFSLAQFFLNTFRSQFAIWQWILRQCARGIKWLWKLYASPRT